MWLGFQRCCFHFAGTHQTSTTAPGLSCKVVFLEKCCLWPQFLKIQASVWMVPHELRPLNGVDDDDDGGSILSLGQQYPRRSCWFPKLPREGVCTVEIHSWGMGCSWAGRMLLVLWRACLLPLLPHMHTRKEKKTPGWGKGMSLVLRLWPQVAPILSQE